VDKPASDLVRLTLSKGTASEGGIAAGAGTGTGTGDLAAGDDCGKILLRLRIVARAGAGVAVGPVARAEGAVEVPRGLNETTVTNHCTCVN
jgi:hypothetical protein